MMEPGLSREVNRRTNVVGRFPEETSALLMVFGILQEQRLNWRKVGMRTENIPWIEEAATLLEN